MKDEIPDEFVKPAFIREERYLVFKISDTEKYIGSEEFNKLIKTSLSIRVKRQLDGKAPLQCVVVEHDWPEYEPTWKAIEDRMTADPYAQLREGE